MWSGRGWREQASDLVDGGAGLVELGAVAGLIDRQQGGRGRHRHAVRWPWFHGRHDRPKGWPLASATPPQMRRPAHVSWGRAARADRRPRCDRRALVHEGRRPPRGTRRRPVIADSSCSGRRMDRPLQWWPPDDARVAEDELSPRPSSCRSRGRSAGLGEVRSRARASGHRRGGGRAMPWLSLRSRRARWLRGRW